jgi:acetyltransferase-like isoleucine patch superfamily enzyme
MFITTIIKKIRNEILRKVVYRKYDISEGFHAGVRVRIWGKTRISIGRNFYIGRDSFIESNVVIGNNVIWGNRVALVGRYDHHYQQVGTPIRMASAIRDRDYSWKGLDALTTIEDDVWVGYGSTILSGVTIAEGSIIAAGSMVTRDVEPYSIYAGTPAKKVRDRFDSAEDLKKHMEMVHSKYKDIL